MADAQIQAKVHAEFDGKARIGKDGLAVDYAVMAGSSVNAAGNTGFEIDGCKYKAGGDFSIGTQVGYGGHYSVSRNKEEGIITVKMGA